MQCKKIIMSKYKYEKEFIFSQRSIDDLRRFLKDKPGIDLTQIVDQKNNNALHQCAFQGSLLNLEQYVKYMKIYWKNNPFSSLNSQQRQSQRQTVSEQQIKLRLTVWVNAKNNQGFTPLHFAAFKGDIQILQYLHSLKADHELKTKSGLGVLHLAAQSDKVKTLIFYRNQIPIDDLDDRKSTPLHWAAFCGSQKVTEYLLAKRAEDHPQERKSKENHRKKKKNPLLEQKQHTDWLNAQDVENQTALHLATTNGNTKIVRRLLIAGAERHIRNTEKKEPIDIARQNEFSNIEQFLNDKYTWVDHVKFFMNIKMKYEPKTRSLKMPLVFLLFSLVLVGIATGGLDYYDRYLSIFWIQESLFALLIFLYLSLIFQSPRLQRGSYSTLERLWLKNQPHKPTTNHSQTIINSVSTLHSHKAQLHLICLRCVQFKPRRSYHCDICNTCIAQYDHHCPWINNCVGKHNIVRFVVFILLLFVVLNWMLAIAIHFLLWLANDINDSIGIFSIRLWVENSPAVMYVFVIVVIVLWAVFAIPLFVLIVVHIRNLCLGKTTYERFSKANQSLLTKSQQQFMGANSGVSNLSQPKTNQCIEMCISRNNDETLLLR